MWTWLPDRLAQALVDWLVQGKFITIFAALFGIGFAIQMDRAAARHQGVTFYARRMAVLLVIGLVHAFGLWWGDILVSYAVCGFLLLLFRNRSQRAILLWAHVMYWFVLVLFLRVLHRDALRRRRRPNPDRKSSAEAIDIYARGTFAQIFAVRARRVARSLNTFVLFLTRIWASSSSGSTSGGRAISRQPGRTPRLVETRAAHRPAARAGGNLLVVVRRLDLPSQPDAAVARDGRHVYACSRSRCRR